jgi:hypothetical protein
VTASTAAAVTPPGCTASNFTVTPATGATINNGGSLTGNPKYFQISVQVTTLCLSLTVQYSPTNNGVKTTDAYGGAPTNGTITWQTTATQWAEGTITFYLYIAGTNTGYSQSVTIACANGKTC